MLEILQYIFSSFWIFCGVIILLYVIGVYCITAPIVAIASIFSKDEKEGIKNKIKAIGENENEW